MYCPSCGKSISDDSNYCSYCGKSLKGSDNIVRYINNNYHFGFYSRDERIIDLLHQEAIEKHPEMRANLVKQTTSSFFSLRSRTKRVQYPPYYYECIKTLFEYLREYDYVADHETGSNITFSKE